MAPKVKPIIAKKMRLKQVKPTIIKAFKEFRREVIFTDFRGTVSAWKKEKPKFKSRVGENKGNLVVQAGLAEESSKGAKKWIFLNVGTSLRWAVMSPNWKSKTKPRQLKSGGGRGKAIIVGKRAMQRRNIKPRPGIDAREWTPEIFETRSPEFVKVAEKANKIAMDNIYG